MMCKRVLIFMLVLALMVGPSLAQESEDEGETVPTGVGEVTVYRLNVRAEPTTDSEVLTVIDFGEQYSVLDTNERGTWVHIRLSDDQTGWVFAEYFRLTDGDGTGGGSVSAPVEGDSVTITRDVNLRVGPSANLSLVTGVPAGTRVQLTGRNADSTWVQATYNRRTVWMIAGVVPESFDVETLPVINDEQVIRAAIAGGGLEWVVQASTPVHALPGTFYPLLETLAPGSVVSVLGRNTTSQWVKIRWPQADAWIPANRLNPGYNVDLLPLRLQ
jgi:uncharacterized protein YgiM (DUF1202 family)